MPAWNNWWHLCLHTHSSWLPGDPRGFRSRDHRIHSTGDYKNPPPADEHDGLHRYHKDGQTPAVIFSPSLRCDVGQALQRKSEKLKLETLAIAVGPTHAHALIQIPGPRSLAEQTESKLKQYASHQIRAAMPGRVWATKGKPIEIKDRSHQIAVFQYLLRHAKEGAWVWDFKRGVVSDPTQKQG